VKNQTGKYLKYAIGEIVLVVIGILIALQINNWNEQRKADRQIRGLLENLVRGLEEDKDYLYNTEVVQEFRSNSFSLLLKLTRDNREPYSPIAPVAKLKHNTIWEGAYPDTMNVDFVNRTFAYSGIRDVVVINTNALDELKSTGLFSTIKNESLKQSINTYYSFVTSKFLIEDWNKDLSISWRQFLRDNYGVLTMELYRKEDPYQFVKRHEPVQVRIHEMIGPARYRSRNATQAILLADELIREIKD
jgi:hypothetical protein